MVDDALDFAPSERTGKPEGGDVREGKFTPPLFFYHASLAAEEQAVFARAFHERSFTDEAVNAVVTTIRARGFDEQARALADSYLQRARQALDRLTEGLPPSPERETLGAFIAHVRDRRA